MNRNVESHFAELPKVDIQRSVFDRSSSHKTSFDVSELIPFYIDECLPGDSFKVTTSCVVRLQTPLTPIMDNIYLDTYYFFVPNRIVWTHWKEFMGESTGNAWIPQTTYSTPKLYPPSGGWNTGTIADYFGIPVGIGPSADLAFKSYPSALPFRGYAMICDQWFRDQNLTDPLNIPTGDSNVNGSNGSNYITDVAKGGKPFLVSKYHDYFTSCLPAAQKHDPIKLLNPSLNSNSGIVGSSFIPVYAQSNVVPTGAGYPTNVAMWMSEESTPSTSKPLRSDSNGNVSYGLTYDVGGEWLRPDNLWADISRMNITVSDLRLAFQLQKYYEKCAHAGTRYREILKEHFGVQSPDARMMIPEYLGGHRFPLSIHQVANAAASSGEYLGDVGALSNTSDVHEDFVKSFTEHGFVIGVCCVRYDHSYTQGMERFWCRNTNLEYYWPVFSSISDQPVFKHEIFWDTSNGVSGYEVFGYQEPYADYRFKQSRCSGEMRPGIANSLATWHLSDYYQSTPSLSDGWIREDKSNVDRVLSVKSGTSNQVFADFYVKNIATRPMPMYSIPGLVDHH